MPGVWGGAVTCAAYRDVPTGLFSTLRVSCAGKHKPGKPHKTDWIKDARICEMFQVARVRLEFEDKPQP